MVPLHRLPATRRTASCSAENGLFTTSPPTSPTTQQVQARLRPHHRHLGRRPPRLHPAREGRDAAPRACRPRSSTFALRAVRGALPRRPEGRDVHPLGRVRHPARAAPRGRAATPAASSTCCARPTSTLDFDPRPRQEPEQREPVYYVQYAHARACARCSSQWGGVAGRAGRRRPRPASKNERRLASVRPSGELYRAGGDRRRRLRAAPDRVLPC